MPLFIDSQLSGYTHSVLSLITPAIPFNIAPNEPLQVGVKGEDQDGTLNQSVTPNGAGGASATPSPVAGTENVIHFNRASHSNSTVGESGWLACLWSAGGGVVVPRGSFGASWEGLLDCLAVGDEGGGWASSGVDAAAAYVSNITFS